jgi:hypothetical protein
MPPACEDLLLSTNSNHACPIHTKLLQKQKNERIHSGDNGTLIQLHLAIRKQVYSNGAAQNFLCDSADASRLEPFSKSGASKQRMETKLVTNLYDF